MLGSDACSRRPLHACSPAIGSDGARVSSFTEGYPYHCPPSLRRGRPQSAYECRRAGQDAGGGCVDGVDVSADVRAVACGVFIRARTSKAIVAGREVNEADGIHRRGEEVAGRVIARTPANDRVALYNVQRKVGLQSRQAFAGTAALDAVVVARPD